MWVYRKCILRRVTTQKTNPEEAAVIHVDAKIINRDKERGHRTFVAYCSEDGTGFGFDEVKKDDANQTDAAELYAIDFAVGSLRESKKRYVLLCDNESVVLMLRKGDPKFTVRTRPIMRKVWQELHKNSDFEIRNFPINQADKLLNQKWRELKNREPK